MEVTGSVLTDDGTPLAGIAVSDGRAWATTGDDGSFSLAAAPDRPVWARRPAAWPGGRWWARPAGEQVTLRLGRRAPGAQPGPARLAHLSDPHVAAMAGDAREAVELAARYGDGTDTGAALGQALADAAERGAGLAVITGDLTDHGTEAEFRRFSEIIAAAPLPVEVVPGNHDHYGHRHQPAPADDPRGAGFLGTATTGRYERALGPRWWSADLAGAHVIGLDWFSARCDIDAGDQRRFAAADLATREPGLPVLVLAHDLPDDTMLAVLRDGAGRAGLLGILTGHWHASRRLADDGCQHLGTAATGFGGLDWSPPQWQMITLTRQDGAARLDREIVPRRTAHRHRAPAAGDRPRGAWMPARHRLGAAQHLGNVASCDDGAVLAPSAGSGGAGFVSRVHPAEGITWTVRSADEAVTGIAVAAGTAVAVSGAGRIVALDARTGRPLWAHQLGRRHRRRVLAAPLLAAGRVIAGDIGAVACLDLATGNPRWELDGPGDPDTLLTYGTGLIRDGLAVMPFGGPGTGLTALRLADGGVAWTDPPGTPPPSSSLTPAGEGDALVVRTATPSLERFELATGRVRWRVPLQGTFSTAAPLVTAHGIVAVTGDGTVHWLDPATGEQAVPRRLRGLRDSYGPYRSTGAGAPTAPVLTARGPVITLLDGSMWRLDPHLAPDLAGDAGAPVTTQPAAAAPDILAAITAGATMRFLDLSAVPASAGPADQTR